MYGTMQRHLQEKLAEIEKAGLYKRERIIAGPQQPEVSVAGWRRSSISARTTISAWRTIPPSSRPPQQALRDWGYGLASVRFICGTQAIHKQLEDRLSSFLGMDDTILYSSCFDANGGLFETLMEAEDAIISDELNHASIIDGVRLSKAARFRYRNGDMQDLEAKLKEAGDARHRLIATDGIFLHGRLSSRGSTRSATSRRSTMRWSWSTTRTPSASSASTAGERRKHVVSKGASTS